MKRTRVYTERDAILYGARLVCFREGHKIETEFDKNVRGGVQMQYDRDPAQDPAAVDSMKCTRCDAKFEVTYPEIGKVMEGKK